LEEKKDIAWRVYTVYFILGIICLLVLIRVVKIQMTDIATWEKQADQLATEMRIIPAKKGNVYSDNGSLLATSNTVYDIHMDLGADGLTDELFNENLDSLSLRLSKMFRNKTKDEYKEWLIDERNKGENGNRYLLIARKINYNQLKELKTFPLYRQGPNVGGLIIEPISKRIRPFGILAARTIGYERPDPNNPQFITRVGIEGAFTNLLNGRDGRQLMRKTGRRWKAVSDKYDVTPEDGADVYSTIDIRLQNVAENALMNQLKKYNARSGCVVLMEVETGYVKAIANLSKEGDSSYYEYFNNAVGVATEPGSTMKTASLMVALDQGMIEMDDSVKTGRGKYDYYDLTMTDSREHGTITIHDALVYSSNIGVSLPLFKAYKNMPEKFVAGIKKIGLHLPVGVNLQGEAKPFVKDPTNASDWSGVSLPQMAIGYEVKMTPLQILAFYNAIANNGTMVKPLFVKEIKRKGNVLQKFEPVVLNHAICKQRTLRLIKNALEDVVEYGTASNLKAANFKIAGKTGTAQIYTRGTYQGKKYLASFVGYFPAENPKYSCIVSIMEPDFATGYYGNSVAGPVFKEIADKIFSYNLQIHEKINEKKLLAKKSVPDVKSGKADEITTILNELGVKNATFDFGYEWASAQRKDGRVLLSEKTVSGSTIPDVKGMGLKDALFLLENKGLKVVVKGSGKVVKQSLTAGSVIQNGQKIIIELKG
jgi:cell division protein FtsI (penicillin-binding protein 3)